MYVAVFSILTLEHRIDRGVSRADLKSFWRYSNRSVHKQRGVNGSHDRSLSLL